MRRPLISPLLGILTALGITLLLLSSASAEAAASSPAWSISAASFPTNFPPGEAGDHSNGPAYILTATNVGAAATDGASPVTVSATLPAGISLLPGSEGTDLSNPYELVSCTGSGQAVECTASGPVPAGDTLEVRVPVEVSPGVAEGTVLTAEASVAGGGGARAATTVPTLVSSSPASFGLPPTPAGLYGSTTNADGSAAVQAGSHPYQYTIGLSFPSRKEGTYGEIYAVGGGVKDLEVTLPHGMVVNPGATPVRCTETELVSPARCPRASAVGTIVTTIKYGQVRDSPATLYNMVPPPGKPAEFAFEVTTNIFVHLFGHLDSDGDYTLSAEADEILAKVAVLSAQTTLWGDPSDESHDLWRGAEGEAAEKLPTPVARTGKAFLTMPSACSAGLATSATADSWLEPGVFTTPRTSESADLQGNPVGVEGCGALAFEPTISAAPTTASADSPTGLDFGLHVPQTEGYEELATANLKDAKVTLPAGMVVNPSAANGLAACTESQIGRQPDVEGRLRFSEAPQTCPDASKLGTVEVETPLLKDEPSPGVQVPHVLPGSIYLAAPHENPFGSLLALYLAVEDEQSGVVAKLAGKVEADPVTGRLTATFAENPELPLEDVALHFFGGETAPLKTPTACGRFSASSDLTPWSSPQGADAHPDSPPFEIGQAPPGGGCGEEPQLPRGLTFEAGTTTPLAGSYSPFVLKLGRPDGTQRISSIDTTLPAGLTGRLAGVPYCPEAAIAAAATATGRAEQASPSCPTASEVGTVDVGAGAGPRPYHVTGHAYLAGPYKGAPISLAIITPAVAGPFDLGVVVTRVALFVDQTTTQIHAVSDPLPTILEGIPLDVRSIVLRLDRPDFTLNPTSCDATAVTGSVHSPSGATAPLTSRFQVGGCSSLAFKPSLKLRVIGRTNRNAKPRLKAVLTTKPGEANIRRAQVNLPHSLFLEQNHIKTVCTRVQWAEGNGNGSACPKGSIYGKAKAWTPLLDRPLEGYVYLRSNGGERKLPDMVAALNGQVNIAVWGKVDSGPNKGLRNTFEVVPDAPVSRFVLELNGKKKGLLVNSEDLCAKKAKRNAIVRFTGQNGKVEQFRPNVAASCSKQHRQTKSGHTRRSR